MCVCVHVRCCLSAGAHKHTIIILPGLAFLPQSSCCKQRYLQISNHQRGLSCLCMANVFLPKTSGSRCRRSKVLLRWRGVFTCVIITLTPLPYTGPFVIQTKKAPIQIFFFFFWAAFAAHLSQVKWLTTTPPPPPIPLIAPCYLGGHMFPIEDGLLPLQHIFLSLCFEPESKLLCLSSSFLSQILPFRRKRKKTC